jgi:hypothetical protein
MSHDEGQGGLAQPRRAVEQGMVDGLLPLTGRLDIDLQLLSQFPLPDKVVKFLRP